MMSLPHLEILTTILETDPNWQRGGGTVNVTRRFVISAALLTVVAVCCTLIVLPVVYAVVAPVPFEYRNLPFPVCDPNYPAFDDDPSPATCRATIIPFEPGDVIPFVVDRCSTDPFTRSTLLPYLVSRNVVNAETGTRIILPSLATNVSASGCGRTVTMAHQLPESIAPGRYYLEGVATVYGRFRTVNAYFRTEDFTVVSNT